MSDVDAITVLGVLCTRAHAAQHYTGRRDALGLSTWQHAGGWSVVLSLGPCTWAGTAASVDGAARDALAQVTEMLDVLARHGHHIGKLVEATVGGGA